MADEKPPKAKGTALPDSQARRQEASSIRDSEAEDGASFWEESAPADLAKLPSARPDSEQGGKSEALAAALFIWLMLRRRYKKKDGSIVSRSSVRAAVDDVVEAAEDKARAVSERLQSGEIDLSTWQLHMEEIIRSATSATSMVGGGGRLQFGVRYRSIASRRVLGQLGYLAGFARELEEGLPLDGRFVTRAIMYASSSTGGYEKVLRDGDRRSGMKWERRILHARESCKQCLAYHREGWVEVGTLPDIGEECDCGPNCKCTFQRSSASARPENLAMPTARLDPEKCRQRSLAAARQGLEAVPIRFLGHGLGPAPIATVPTGYTLTGASGTLPNSEAESLERINAVLHAQGIKPLEADRVLVHTIEAGSSNYIPSRTMFLADSTLKNVAKGASNGFAFMNSHRTGGLSSNAELPYGRTFAGRFESYSTEDGGKWGRSLISFYMLKGVHPNGDHGPSTDDFSAMIEGGTVFDVSLGISLFRPVCDVCNNDMRARNEEGMLLCPHVPGTTHKMKRDEMASQKRRGVPAGVATYSLHDGQPSEVSAVYNGAVPGAGFTRAMTFSRRGLLTPAELAEARETYSHLLSPARKHSRVFSLNRSHSMPRKFSDIMAALGLSSNHQVDEEGNILPPDGDEFSDPPTRPAPTPAPKQADPALAAIQTQLAETQRLLADERDARLKDQRTAFVLGCDKSSAEFGEKHRDRLNGVSLPLAVKLHKQLQVIDKDVPGEFSLAETFATVLGACAPHKLGAQNIAAGSAPKEDPQVRILSNQDEGGYDPAKAARAQVAAGAESLGMKRKGA